MFKKQFHFIDGGTIQNCLQVLPTSDGNPQTFMNNGGWLTDERHHYQKGNVLMISTSVPSNGNYELSITLKVNTTIDELTLFTNRREVIASSFSLKAGEAQIFTHWVHISPYSNEVGGLPVTDRHVYLSLIGVGAARVNITATVMEVEVPTLHIIGDSITTDDEAYLPYHPQATWSGWGQHVGQFLANITVDDQAHNGMTTVCYRDDGYWQHVVADCRPGDFVLMQFGHNDQKRTYLQPFGTYAENLRRFVREAEAAGLIPILVSPLSRIPNQDANGTWFDTLAPFAEATRLVANEFATAFIDLHTISFAKLKALSQPSRYFMDAAHTNDYGADLVASWVLTSARFEKLALSKFITPRLSTFAPREATAIDILLDNEQPVVKAAPVTNVYADAQALSAADQAVVLMAIQRHLIDPCVGRLHPAASLSLGMALYAFAAVAKPFVRRPYCAAFVDVSAHEWLAPYVQAALDSGLWQMPDFAGDQCNLQTALTGRQLLTLVVRNTLDEAHRGITPQACEQYAKEREWQWANYRRDEPVTRLQAYTVMLKTN